MKVSAPASTANIGPGFDCLGAAVSLVLEIDTSQPEELPKMIRRAIRAAGGSDAPVFGVTTSDIPRARGLGSSAACVAAGLVIGSALSGRDPDPDELLRLGTPIEGHPDNLAAALYGGLTLVLPDQSVLRYDPSESVRPVILLPSQVLSTAEARRVLPNDVPRGDAVANVARASGLLSLLTGAASATRELLHECTADLLHQPYRAPLMTSTSEVIERLRSNGIAAAVSGAGPSVVCLVLRGDEGSVRAVDLDGWQILELDWNREGARVIES